MDLDWWFVRNGGKKWIDFCWEWIVGVLKRYVRLGKFLGGGIIVVDRRICILGWVKCLIMCCVNLVWVLRWREGILYLICRLFLKNLDRFWECGIWLDSRRGGYVGWLRLDLKVCNGMVEGMLLWVMEWWYIWL